MGAKKTWCYEWIEEHIEENENGTATITLDEQRSQHHFPSVEAAETYLWVHEVEQAFIDALAHRMNVEKNRRKYGDL